MKLLSIPGNFSFSIADICVSVIAKRCGRVLSFSADDALLKFRSSQRPFLTLDIELCRPEGLPVFSGKRLVFDNEVNWNFQEFGAGKLLWQEGAFKRSFQGRAALLDAKLRRGKVFCPVDSNEPRDLLFNPVSYPLDQLLYIYLLSQARGGLFHAAAVDYRGQGLLFLGKSGQGKTTMAELWYRQKRAVVLNDDRVAVRYKKGVFWLYGTPWHGSGRFALPRKTRLHKVFFLHHSKDNDIRALGPAEASTRLFTALFPPVWSKNSISLSLGLCCDIARKVPCYDLHFSPYKSVIPFIEELL
ncbi:MAG TPA: hypothetical protein DCL35_05425 [Candidatus Omnitrophica bacterium]|nr:hypothetical protein [Candidatus Omnitrophota bacterium]